MKILCVFGRHNYGDSARGEGVEYTHFLPALRALGHEVFFFESFARAGYADFASLNRALLEAVEERRPDLVFTVLMLAEVWLETIGLIRRTGCKVLNWSTDDSWKYREFSRLIAADFDLYATTSSDAFSWYGRDGIRNIAQTQWAASSIWLTKPKLACECGVQVSFIGSAYGDRPARIARLRAAGVEVECHGHGWPNGPLAAERIPQIFRDSVLSLNFSEAGGGSGQQIKARVFEVPAAGGMLLTETAPHLEDYFAIDTEVAQFCDDAELFSKIRDLLAEPELRNTLALAAHERVVREHTYERRMSALLERLGAVVPGPRAVDWAEFERHAARHSIGRWLRTLRTLLVAFCSFVCGEARGSRAARRALFEISWRIAGRHTYTAAGWPGRLFYRES